MTDFVRTIVVSSDHPSLPGHFPGRPIVPGVLLLDLIVEEISAAQSGGVRLVGVASTKFQRPVRPNELVTVNFRFVEHDSQSLRVRFQASVDGQSAAEGTLLFTIDAH